MSIGVAIPSIPPRAGLLSQAVNSVLMQTMAPSEIIVTIDNEGKGAWHNRNRALAAITAEWTAFLDDDDVMYPQHLEALYSHAEETGADLVYPWFEVQGGDDPLGRFGMPFDGDHLRRANYIPITYLVRTELAKEVGGFPALNSPEWPHPECEDWGFLIRLLDAGAKFSHLAEKTWAWSHRLDADQGILRNTSGRSWIEIFGKGEAA